MSTLVQLEHCRLDMVRRRAFFGVRAVKLTAREVEVPRYPLARVGRVVSKTDLERDVWELHHNVRTDAVSIAVRRLRAKIELETSTPIHLQTVHDVGWRFQLESAPEVGEASPMPLVDRIHLDERMLERFEVVHSIGVRAARAVDGLYSLGGAASRSRRSPTSASSHAEATQPT